MTTIAIDLSIYSLSAVMRACHTFTDRYTILLRDRTDHAVTVEFTSRNREFACDPSGEFANALLDAQLRETIASETRVIRELLVAEAFCEANLLDRSEVESDEHDDPRGIAR